MWFTSSRECELSKTSQPLICSLHSCGFYPIRNQEVINFSLPIPVDGSEVNQSVHLQLPFLWILLHQELQLLDKIIKYRYYETKKVCNNFKCGLLIPVDGSKSRPGDHLSAASIPVHSTPSGTPPSFRTLTQDRVISTVK